MLYLKFNKILVYKCLFTYYFFQMNFQSHVQNLLTTTKLLPIIRPVVKESFTTTKKICRKFYQPNKLQQLYANKTIKKQSKPTANFQKLPFLNQCHLRKQKVIKKINKIQGEETQKEKDNTISKKRYLIESTKNYYQGLIEWKMGQFIGCGTSGQVYKAFVINNGKTIAVKKMLIDNQQKHDLQNFESQIKTLKSLKHKRIIKYYGGQFSQTHRYIYMEYISEGSLKKNIQTYGCLQQKTLKIYLKKILEAISYIHSKNIIHRDIKASNILLTVNADIKIADFGCSIRKDSSSQNEVLIGSILWMAPQVIKDKKYSTKSDIWSIGCLIIQLITGKLPWNQKNFDNELEAMLTIGNSGEMPQIPKNISNGLNEIIKECLYVDYEKRPSCTKLLQNKYFNQI